MKININNEYSVLKSVLMASVKNFKLHDPINITQKKFYKNNPPVLEVLIEQQDNFINILQKYNVDIHFAKSRSDSPLQINTRDIAFSIGDKFFISNMKEEIRKNEHLALDKLVNEIETEVMYVENGVVEGGDIIVDNITIYTGISERTNNNGFEWLKKYISNEYNIIPIRLKNNFLHLDVVFTIISDDCAMIYSPAIEDESIKDISKKFNLINVEDDEQFNLATNVFAIGNKIIICDKRNIKANNLLDKNGFKLIELDFCDITKIGGSFRCSTCPLIRE